MAAFLNDLLAGWNVSLLGTELCQGESCNMPVALAKRRMSRHGFSRPLTWPTQAKSRNLSMFGRLHGVSRPQNHDCHDCHESWLISFVFFSPWHGHLGKDQVSTRLIGAVIMVNELRDCWLFPFLQPKFPGFSLAFLGSCWISKSRREAIFVNISSPLCLALHWLSIAWGVLSRQNSGPSEVHSDDNGLVMPPALAAFQVVIVQLGEGHWEKKSSQWTLEQVWTFNNV